MKLIRSAFLLIILATVVLSGCYTKLANPGEEDDVFSSRHGDEECIECHPNYHDLYGFSHYYYPSSWEDNDRWGHYYAEPWWWEYYWYEVDEDDSDSPRTGDVLIPVRPVYDTGNANTGVMPIGITRGSGGGTTSSGTGSTGGNSGKATDDNQKVETKQREDGKTSDTNRKPTRRSGRMKKK